MLLSTALWLPVEQPIDSDTEVPHSASLGGVAVQKRQDDVQGPSQLLPVLKWELISLPGQRNCGVSKRIDDLKNFPFIVLLPAPTNRSKDFKGKEKPSATMRDEKGDLRSQRVLMKAGKNRLSSRSLPRHTRQPSQRELSPASTQERLRQLPTHPVVYQQASRLSGFCTPLPLLELRRWE